MAENDIEGEDAAIARVAGLAQAYRRLPGNGFLQHGPIWNADHWDRVLTIPELASFDWNPRWPTKITRQLILGQWETASTEASALEAFFLTMAWGFGTNFRGPWKTLAMFDSMRERNFGEYLLQVRELARQSCDVAYRSLLAKKIKQLGPVYASKLLYAMSPGGRRSPVMDIWIQRWGKQKNNIFRLDFTVNSTQSINENSQSLKRFTEFCNKTLNQLNSSEFFLTNPSENDAGFVEFLIFWDAKYQMKKPWQNSNDFPAWVQDEILR